MKARLFGALAASFLLGAGGADSAPRDPDSRLISRRTMDGMRVEAIAESDGGQLVRMRRTGGGYSFEYSLEFWRGNGGVVTGATFRSGKCRSGDASAIQPTGNAMARTTLDFRLGEYLRECPLTRVREAELRRSIDAAWPAFSAMAETALAETVAENEAIADYGKGE
jgi:hypothetical protein